MIKRPSVNIHPHARIRMTERGATVSEVIGTVEEGEEFPAKYGRIGFRRNFASKTAIRDKHFTFKQIEVFVAKENDKHIVVTVIVKYFGGQPWNSHTIHVTT